MGTDYHQRLADAAEEYRQAQSRLEETRTDLARLVRAATRDGMRQADIVRATGHLWTREHIRKLLRRHD